MAETSIPGKSQTSSIVLPTGKAALPIKAGQANVFKAKSGEHYGNLKKKDAEEQLLDNVAAKPTGEDAKPVDAEGTGLTLESAFIQAPVAGSAAAMPEQLAQGLPPSAQGAAGASLNEGNNLGGQVFAYAGADALLLAQAETGIKPDVVASGAADPVVAAAGIGPLGILGFVGLGLVAAAAAGGSSESATVAPTVDTTAPTAVLSAATDNVGTVTGVVASGGVTDDTVLVLSGTNEASATVNVYNGSTLLGAATISGTTWSYNATVANGTTYTFNAKETDVAGNVSAATSNYTITGDTTAPTETNTSGAYTSSTDTLVLTGTNYSTLLEAGETAATDIKARLDWTKLSWDIDGDNAATADVSFALSDISSAKVTDGTHLTIVLASATGTSLEATSGYGGTTLDTLDVTAGFAKDAAGNAATTDTTADGMLTPSAFVAGDAVINPGITNSRGAGRGRKVYYWDRSGNGTSADTGSLNGGIDYTTHDVLDGIFTSTLSEVNAGTVGTWTDTTDLRRDATLKGCNGSIAHRQRRGRISRSDREQSKLHQLHRRVSKHE